MENKKEQLSSIREYVYNLFHDDTTGHDFHHMKRVARIATTLARKERADLFICESAAWLHDIGDKKLFANPELARNEMDVFLAKIGVKRNTIEHIYKAMNDVSFSKGNIPATLEGKVVQDADRLDAMGAIGIARVFAFGGTREQLIYHDEKPENTSIQHFYDKLLKLKSLMNTQAAIEIAQERHVFMENYLDQFFLEWKS
ncbi:HD domain-containing protein [Virgibacillus necropolis]|uniref:Metal-dependent phosphohydrolase n=1 Tax=Virgibacillus necropolis TaxID=163877 RepID=A0A221MD27_9BACI|nr:HD domain-containing protein [Virgibacillus necropolis]ASN05555.1 metal-dependent phosphohydrolase [Virgibacillus necropolis]